MANDDDNSWRGILYEKLSPAAKLPHRGLNDALQAATQAGAQGNNIASEALNTASQIMTAAQTVASEAISKASLEIGAGISKVCVVEADKSTCADYTADDLRSIADTLSDASGNKAWKMIPSTLSYFHFGLALTCILFITIASFLAYFMSMWPPLHGARPILLPVLTLFDVLITGLMLTMMVVIRYIRSKAVGPLENSPCLVDTIICSVASVVKSVATLTELTWGIQHPSPK